MIKRLIVKKLKEKYFIYDRVSFDNHILSFSQEGEDIFLSRYFKNKESGFYVDVGAHHPQRYSNTFVLYKKGWTGINIDAAPGSMKNFERLRPDDINLEIAVADNPGHYQYYQFEESALNTLDNNLANEYISQDRVLLSTVEVETKRLKDIFDNYLPAGTDIDLLNIDVEGFDYEVLISNDWSKFRPEIVLTESLEFKSLDNLDQCKVCRFLYKKEYKLIAKTFNTLFFKRN